MRHKESNLQIKNVRWFRYQYPQYAMLLTHPINEGSGHTAKDRLRQGIHKAEGAVAGTADLLFFMPAIFDDITFHGLAIEMKEEKGRQSQEQKNFQKMIEAAGWRYVISRSEEDFQKLMNDWIAHVEVYTRRNIAAAHVEIEQAATAKAREKFKNLLKPRK